MRAELSLVQPARHRFLEDAAAKPASAGDDEDTTFARATAGANKAKQRPVRLVLAKPVQIEPRLDPLLTALQSFRVGAVDTGKSVERDRLR